jgi:AbrB family looped-hinge helix DNA binding protein
MPTSTVTTKGQITIPIEVRKSLRLNAGDKVDFFETRKGEFAIRPKKGSIMQLKGILRKLGYVPTIERMDQDVLEAVSKDYLRSIEETGDEEADSQS